MADSDKQPYDAKTYFAVKPANETASILLHKAFSFFNDMTKNNYLDKLRLMWKAYHGIYMDGADHEIAFTGEQGELEFVAVNHFRNICRNIYNMITSSRPTMDARAINTDYKSLAQANLANGILDYYMREKNLETVIKSAAEICIPLGAGFVKLEWNATAGNAYDYDEDSGTYNYEGEVEFSTLSPFDVVVDGTKNSWRHEWILVRTYQNRFNLMAKFPELSEKIKGLPTKSEQYRYRLNLMSNDDTDDIAVYEFYHKRTEAVPDGRYLLFLDADVNLIDMPLPYDDIPVYRIAAGEILGTPYGYTDMFDMYPLQEVINATYSAIATSANTFGISNVWIPEGANLTVENLEGSLNIVKGSAKPEPLNLTQIPQELFTLLNLSIQSAETLTGVNSVSRGNPEASLRTGTALALVQSMALQYSSSLQSSYVKLIEDVGTGLLNILKRHANTPKLIALVGKNNRTELKEFTGDQILDVNRVVVDMGNPLARCLEKDTPILMYDGSIKKVQDVKIDDLVMGPDSLPRTVTNTNIGNEMMYKVKSKDKHRKVEYGCNESHILTLKYCSDDYRYDVKKGEILDITVKDYLKLPERHKRILQGFKTSIEFDKKQLEIPPYILGAWLGDGHSRTTALTSMDNELVDAWSKYADSIGMQVRIQENKQPNKSKVYFITSGESHGSSYRNSFMNHLRGYELIDNKHIPKSYLLSSREDRLQLLAGLIDTDGSRIDETYIFTQKDDKLTNQVIFLAESLGFRTTCRKVKTKGGKITNYFEGETNKISIGGNTWEIPCKLPRKQCIKVEKARDWLNYGIEVTPVGEGTFYGFTLEEEPHFILGDFTVTHNTIAGRAQIASELLQMHMFTTPEQYLQVLKTGNLDIVYEGTTSQLLCIKKENEMMLEGKSPMATMFDQHSMHIKEHQAVISDPELREKPELLKNVLAHVQEHITYLRTTDPGILAMLGEQPLPPAPGGPAPQVMGQTSPPTGQATPGQQPGNPPTPPGPGGPTSNGGQPPQAALGGNTAPQMMVPGGQMAPGTPISGPGTKKTPTPHLPKVAGQLLPNPSLQQAALNNVK